MRARLPQLRLMLLRSVPRPCLVALVVLCLAQAASACPTCKAGLGAHDPTHGDLVGAYMWSILFMMAMPFTLLASFSGYFYWLVRKARAAAQLQALDSQAPNSRPAMASAQEAESEAVHA